MKMDGNLEAKVTIVESEAYTAEEVVKLKAERDRYRKALMAIVAPFDGEMMVYGDSQIEGHLIAVLDIAKKALEGDEE